MSVPTPEEHAGSPGFPAWSLILAWLAGLALCVYGLFDGVADWPNAYCLAATIWLAFAPAFWGWHSRRKSAAESAAAPAPLLRRLISIGVILGCSLGMSAMTSRMIGDLPPAYHDEFSYLFQAKTFLAGRTWFPSHPTHSELFDQMHVLNDNGRMASRYFPGTGLWLAPFVAMGHPYWGHWLCGMLASVFVYAAGCEMRNERTGIFAGMLTALSPGLALFGNLLLAHHPTLVGLSFFLWMMARLRNHPSVWPAVGAALGLTWAMFCRPMTAAGFGLPFGVWTAWWLIFGSSPRAVRGTVFAAFAIIISVGIAVQLAYNASITGSVWSSPYQLYTDIYTPRHVYGFNNVTRGEQHVGPKVIEAYDQWAENLTPKLAAENAFVRLVTSSMLIWDLLPLAMIAVLAVVGYRRLDTSMRLALWGIVSLHVVHVPYWYVGIMGWHYVYESLILWTLLAGGIADQLLRQWRAEGKRLPAVWLGGLVMLTMAVNLATLPGMWGSKLERGASTIAFSRQKHADFQQLIEKVTEGRSSLVLVGPHRDAGHIDYVNNEPGLTGRILLGRYVPDRTDLEAIVRDFPDREVFLCEPDRRQVRQVNP